MTSFNLAKRKNPMSASRPTRPSVNDTENTITRSTEQSPWHCRLASSYNIDPPPSLPCLISFNAISVSPPLHIMSLSNAERCECNIFFNSSKLPLFRDCLNSKQAYTRISAYSLAVSNNFRYTAFSLLT